MGMTRKLYETDGLLAECTAVITGYENIEGKHYITLDQTILFPEGGGQKADTGLLIVEDNAAGKSNDDGNVPASNETGGRSVRVLDGHERVKGCSLSGPVYLIDAALQVGDSVLCKPDWEQRFSRMQQHSGEHILSGLVHANFGYDNVSFHLSDTDPVIVCFNGPLDHEDILRMETLANQAIWDNIPINVSYPSKEELASITYRSKIEIEGQVRLVTIPGIDVCACCAPHLPSTGHIGLIKIVSSASYKNGGTQLNILCGSRALALLQHEYDLLQNLAKEYSTSAEKLTGVILTQRDELLKAREELGSIREKKLLDEIVALKDEDAPCIFGEDLSPHAMKICYNALTDRFDRYCGVFSGSDEEGYRFYAGHPAHDSKILAGKMREELQANGGGSSDMIQGKLQKKKEEIRLFFLK